MPARPARRMPSGQLTGPDRVARSTITSAPGLGGWEGAAAA